LKHTSAAYITTAFAHDLLHALNDLGVPVHDPGQVRGELVAQVDVILLLAPELRPQHPAGHAQDVGSSIYAAGTDKTPVTNSMGTPEER
jgi:hypothetical protein